MEVRFETGADFLRVMSPFPADSVVAGAWVLALYRHREGAHPDALQTRDIDLALLGTISNRDEQVSWLETIADAVLLLPEYAIKAKGGAVGNDPYSQLVPRRERAPLPVIEVIAELVPPARSSFKRRFRSRDGGEARLLPQQVDNLRLLFIERWFAPIGFGSVPIPNPLSFVAQKALIRESRFRQGQHKANNDVAAVFEVAHLYSERPDLIRGLSRRIRESSSHSAKKLKLARTVLEVWTERDKSVFESGLPAVRLEIQPGSVAVARRVLCEFLNTCDVEDP